MFEIFFNVIAKGGFELVNMLDRLDRAFAHGSITADEWEALRDMAQGKADPKLSLAPLEQRVSALELAVKALQMAQDAPEGEEGTDTPEQPEEDVWPDYVQPTGAHDAYMAGDRVTFNGKRYTCKMDGTVWTPADYPAAWEEHVEEAEV